MNLFTANSMDARDAPLSLASFTLSLALSARTQWACSSGVSARNTKTLPLPYTRAQACWSVESVEELWALEEVAAPPVRYNVTVRISITTPCTIDDNIIIIVAIYKMITYKIGYQARGNIKKGGLTGNEGGCNVTWMRKWLAKGGRNQPHCARVNAYVVLDEPLGATLVVSESLRIQHTPPPLDLQRLLGAMERVHLQ